MKRQKHFGNITDYRVHETADYGRFRIINGNRAVKTAHKNTIFNSIKKYGAKYAPIMINENYEIIDGQTRFAAFKESKLPVPYFICRGYGIKDVPILNQGQLNWTPLDFAESYAEMGKISYRTYLYFRKKYKFSHQINVALLTTRQSVGMKLYKDEFEAGLFKVTDLSAAQQYADLIMDIGHWFEAFRQRNFVYALFCLFEHPEYRHRTLTHKLSYQSAKLTRQATRDDYLSNLEKIYNYNSHNGRLRFGD